MKTTRQKAIDAERLSLGLEIRKGPRFSQLVMGGQEASKMEKAWLFYTKVEYKKFLKEVGLWKSRY